MIEEIKQDVSGRMSKTIEVLKLDFTKIRTGRANTSLLDHVMVPYYGSDTPLKQVANVTVEDSRTLAVNPWERNMIQAIEKAIMSANLGLNPTTAGTVIRIPLPPLTEERRKDLIKVVRKEGEGAKVAIRNIRRDANADFKSMVKEKMASEDEERKALDDVQKTTDEFVAKIDELLKET
jgi:ribosome recycling factor